LGAGNRLCLAGDYIPFIIAERELSEIDYLPQRNSLLRAYGPVWRIFVARPMKLTSQTKMQVSP
jgi:hypothetical protein